MTDMQRLFNELEELRTENIALKNQNGQLQRKNERLKNECSRLHAQIRNASGISMSGIIDTERRFYNPH